MHATTLVLFASTAVLLILTPGPDLLYVLTRGIGQGRRAAFAATCGIGSGVLVHTFFAAVGISALIRSSAFAFMAVKYLGAAYLLLLGIKTWRDQAPLRISAPGEPVDIWRIFRQSAVANLLNPKVILFFLAFLPQFVDFKGGRVTLQMLVLGTICMLLSVGVFGAVGYFAGGIGAWLRRKPSLATRLKHLTGGTFVALGVRMAWPER